ncbi:MAG: ADP-ribosylglycohydrolase family protein, partial [Kofleriaceae bacterium]|nr:ADP-ribosylglycohydrolase family protein [Kofleriaceae bacterium]
AAAVDAARAAIAADLAVDATPDVHGAAIHLQRTAGFVRVALRLACWHLRRGTPWRDAVVDVVNRGGDADTNGAIVGALLGAAAGEDAIPAAWRDRVVGALAGDRSPLGTTYHPRALLALVP